MLTTTLPPELSNEPIAARDNHCRPERTISRVRFEFCARPGLDYRCCVGHVTYVRDWTQAEKTILQKWQSDYSVLNVYDAYGLDITLLFMSHLRTLRASFPRMIDCYLNGSLHALRDVTCSTSSVVVDMHAAVLEELRVLDSRQLKASEPVTRSPELPIEILAVIINSMRVSKLLAKEVQRHRCHQIPSLDLFEGWRQGACFFSILGRSAAVSPGEEAWFLSYDASGESRLSPMSGSEAPPAYPPNSRMLAYSISHYEVELMSRQCDPRVGIPIMLQRLREPRPIDRTCALIVQLSSDLNVKRETKQLLGDDGLEAELERLITLALSRVHRHQQA